jgi:hypothetical protein
LIASAISAFLLQPLDRLDVLLQERAGHAVDIGRSGGRIDGVAVHVSVGH